MKRFEETGVSMASSIPSAQEAQSRYSVLSITSRLLHLMSSQHACLGFSVVMSCAAAVCSLLPYGMIGWFVVGCIPGYTSDNDALAWTIVGTLLGLMGEKLCFGVATHAAHLAAFDIQRQLRLRMAAHLERVSLGFCERQSKGHMRTLFVDDIETLEDGMAHLITEVSAAVLIPSLALIGIAVLDWKLALLCALPMVFGFFHLRRMIDGGRHATFEYLSLNAEVANCTAQYTDGLSTFRAFDHQNQAVQRPMNAFKRMSDFSSQWLRQAVIPGTTSQVLLTTPLAMIAPFGALLVIGGYSSLTAWIFSVALTFGFGDLFSAIHGISHRILQQGQLLDRVDALLAEPEMPSEKPFKTPVGTALKLDNVTFSYGEGVALEGVNIDLQPGSFVALVGASGSGKSTLARLLARFDDPTKGGIYLGGVDLRNIETRALYEQVGFVFQDVFLFKGTVIENIRLGRPGASLTQVRKAAQLAQAHQFIEALPQGYETELAEGGIGLSGGQRQRLSIARAILRDSPILILDEATSFADPESEDEIQKGISNLAAGRTVIVIAHRLHTIVHADKIIMLEQGRVVEQGTHRELVELNGRFARQWSAALHLEAHS